MGGDLGAMVAGHYANGAIDYSQVTAAELSPILPFYNSRVRQKVDLSQFKALVTGNLKIQILRALSFYLPIKPFNTEARLNAARTLLKQIPSSA